MGKRAKQYKKLMRGFELLGFRQPYQLLITSDVLLDTTKVDLMNLFEKTLSTKQLKPMITQCCIVCFASYTIYKKMVIDGVSIASAICKECRAQQGPGRGRCH